MKVGTDGVLLGAWVSVGNQTGSILDIGTGTGLIALMLAQRSTAEVIDAVELDPDAYEQAVHNFEASSWGDRLFCYHAGFQEFAEEMEEAYDLIVSNPPYYEPQAAAGSGDRLSDPSRRLARYSDALDMQDVFAGIQGLLAPEGRIALVFPYQDEATWMQEAAAYGFHPKRITRVRGRAEAPLRRSLVEFSRKAGEVVADELVIELQRHQYTPEYIDLTKDFYLKM